MARIIIVTNPCHDDTMRYLDAWFEKVIKIASAQKDTKIIELKKEEVTREKLSELVEKENPQFVIFNGHGTKNLISGFESNVLVQKDENESILAGRIIHSMSCASGRDLAESCIKLGTRSFIGYKEKFWLITVGHKVKHGQQNDPVARFFIEPAYEAIIALIEGKTVQEAYERSQKLYAENLRVLISSKNEDYNTNLAGRLFSNRNHQVCLGDLEASF